MLLLAPFKWVFIDTRWLLVFQPIILALGSLPVYRIARRTWGDTSGSHRIAVTFALLYLLYPTIGWTTKFDFHPIALTPPLLLFAWDAAELKRWRRVSILLLLAMFCKEEVGFVVALFGLYWYFSPERWRGGALWAVVGVGWTLIGLFVIIPGAQGKVFLPNQADLRYAWLFHGTWAERWAYITGPDTPVKFRFLIQLLTPLLFLPLLKPRISAIGAPIIGLALLSTRISQSSVYHHYMCDVVPFLMIAAIKAVYELPVYVRRSRIRLRPAMVQRLAFVGLLSATLLMFVAFNPFTFVPREPYAPIYGWEGGASLEGLYGAEPLIAPSDCLTTSNNIAAHYGMRQKLYVIGIGNYTACDQVLVDMADTRFISFGSPQQYACQLYAEGNFQPVFFRDSVVILKNGAPPDLSWDAKLDEICASALPTF